MMDESGFTYDWHGWRSGRTSLHIGPLPRRRRIALYEFTSNGQITPLAYFKDEASAARAMSLFGMWIGTNEVCADRDSRRSIEEPWNV